MSFELMIDDVLRFVLVLVRVTGIIVVLPVFGVRMFPVQMKIFFGVAIAMLVTLSMPDMHLGLVELNATLVLLILREAFVGFLLGFVSSIIFRGIEYAGEMVGMQMGLSIANVIDPQSGAQVSVVSQFQRLVLVLLFFSIDGHYMLIKALLSSYELTPVALTGLNMQAAHEAVRMGGQVFAIALQLAAPATIMLLLTHLVLAVISRAVPQMNVFIVGFPLTIAVGMFMLAVSMPVFVQVGKSLFGQLPGDLTTIMKLM